MVFAMLSGSGCQRKIVIHNAGTSSYCRPSISELLLDFGNGEYRPATLDETVDLLECIEILREN